MLKPRVSRVVFSTGIAPSESEYFDEINAYRKKTLWLLLLFISRTMIAAGGGVQMTYYTIINDIEGICYIPEFNNTNWTYYEIAKITTEYGQNSSARLNTCEYFDLDYNEFAKISFNEALKLKEGMSLNKVKTCFGGYILLSDLSSKYHTVDTPFCHAREIAKRMSLLSSGPYVVSCIFFGFLADLFGRKIIATITTILWIFCAFCSVIVPSISIAQLILFSASRFFQIAADLVTYVNLLEICHKKIRFLTVLTLYGYTIGFLICTRFADHLNFSWTYLQYISFSFALFALFHCFYVPESPRWLINKSKYKEALKVMEEIIGYVPNEILFEDEGSETPFSCQIFWDMSKYLRKRKIKIVIILAIIGVIIGFVYQTQVWRVMETDFPLKATIVAASADLLSLPYALIVYAALGKKYGLFWTFISLNFTSFVTLCLHDTSSIDVYANAILILNAVTARLGIACSMQSLMETITVAFIDWQISSISGRSQKFHIYNIFNILVTRIFCSQVARYNSCRFANSTIIQNVNCVY
ncbi:solute carrier family 22 member 2-like isoform X3 [Harmonia axyridis]|uniref:solute carrier family 22 member 2-like isoform X3 n=1 Tax=Harmonia axyridis TaxID=115357 RepID=UPI001E2774A3|nr:solute carrier family 22 member 2-like isoform X3 [Harmonia axyridis]